jgi:hypothetical protein
MSKLDTLITGQKDIESRLSNLEKKLDRNNNDMIDSDGIKVIKMYIINYTQIYANLRVNLSK